MNPTRVVVHVEQRQGVYVVVQLLAKGVRQSGEPAVLHPDVEVLPSRREEFQIDPLPGFRSGVRNRLLLSYDNGCSPHRGAGKR